MSDPLLARDIFTHCPRCGATGNGAPIGTFQFDCTTCEFRYYFNAAVSASAVITRPDGRVYFIRRARDPGRGKLGFPGGFVDPFETVETALARETKEEVGMSVERYEYLGSFVNPYIYREVIYPVADLFFVVHVADHTDEIDTSEVLSTAWLNPADISPNDLAFDSQRGALAAYLSLVSR